MDYAFQTDELVFMATDLGTAGSLEDALKLCNNEMPEDRVAFYSAEVILALLHIHRNGMIYRDLKPQNILLNADGHIKLVDMGGSVDISGKLGCYDRESDKETLFAPDTIRMLAKLSGSKDAADGIGTAKDKLLPANNNAKKLVRPFSFNSSSRLYGSAERPCLKRATSIMGTAGYMAPEMLIQLSQNPNEQKGYTAAVDFWSLGITMFKLITGSIPFENIRVAGFMLYVSTCAENAANIVLPEYKHYYDLLANEVANEKISYEALQVICELLQVDETKRLGSSKDPLKSISSYKFFKHIKWNLLEQKLVNPPFTPVSIISSADMFGCTFDDMLVHYGKASWLNVPPTLDEQSYFENWYVMMAICHITYSCP